MPYVIETLTGDRMREVALEKAPLGPGFRPDELTDAASMQIVGSTASDPGDDWVEFVLLHEDGSRLAAVRNPGY